MTLRKDQANAMCAMKTFYFGRRKVNNQICRSKHPRLMEVTTPSLVLFFFFLLPWDLMINSFKDHQRPNSRRWPNAWKSPPLPQNSRNNPPTHYPAHIFPATDTHLLRWPTLCGVCFFPNKSMHFLPVTLWWECWRKHLGERKGLQWKSTRPTDQLQHFF